MQGELAHRLVKRLYGLTNKKDAPEQIARHYRRAHHFNGSDIADPSSDELASRREDECDSPDFHHTISTSRNNPTELASFSSNSTQDPAAKVGPCAPLQNQCSHTVAFRTSSLSSVSISSAGSLAKASVETTPTSLRMKNGTQSAL